MSNCLAVPANYRYVPTSAVGVAEVDFVMRKELRPKTLTLES